MNGYQSAIEIFPMELRRALSKVPIAVKQKTQEIRLRTGQAVCLGYNGREQYFTSQGEVCTNNKNAVICLDTWIQQTVDILCEGSFYAHQEEWKNGFLTASNGCRVGIAGTALTEQGKIMGYRNITALCVRVSREHFGCAESLAPYLYDGKPHSLLVCGEPSSGKTSILRDAVRLLKKERLSVSVIDERGELSRDMVGCDVLKLASKAGGLEQAIRCLSPQVVVFDELGGKKEWESIKEGMLRGVPTITSVHCVNPQELLFRDGGDLLYCGVFEHIVVLKGREAPGLIDKIYKTKEWLCENSRILASRCNGNVDWLEHKAITKQENSFFGVV